MLIAEIIITVVRGSYAKTFVMIIAQTRCGDIASCFMQNFTSTNIFWHLLYYTTIITGPSAR